MTSSPRQLQPLSLADLPRLEQAILARPPQSRILARTDLNVPLAADGSPASFARIDALLPLLEQTKNHTLLLCSHFGRPQKQSQEQNSDTAKLSLRPLIPFLEQRWKRKVIFLGDCQNPQALTPEIIASLNAHNDGTNSSNTNSNNTSPIGLFENLRFHPGEEQNDLAFAASLSAHAEIYVNDAFSVCHRAHASTSAITNLLPSYAGPSLTLELETLLPLIANQEAYTASQKSIAPSIALLGGAKVSTKIDLLQSLMHRCSAVCLGGAMANCFLAARGILPSTAFAEKELHTARLLEKQFQEREESCLLLLPVDGARAPQQDKAGSISPRIEVLLDSSLEENLEGGTASIGDIGSESCRAIEELLDKAARGTRVVVNGPVGIVERPPCDVATLRLLRFLAAKTERGLLRTIAGGGDTLAALERADVSSKFTHLSLGGGAFLALLSFGELPALEALRKNKREALS